MERIKLFAETTTPSRIKLFSEDGSGTHVLKCADCGYTFETTAHTTNQLCPKCGSTRFNVVREVWSPEVAPEKVEDNIKENKIRLFGLTEEEEFQKEFNETTDEVELKLKEFSGKTIDSKTVEKEFGMSAEELSERGFAEILEDGSVNVLEDSFMQSRLFSKILISITKTLELDPAVTMSAPEVGVQKLEEVSDLCPKSIAIIKKIHGVEEDSNSKENWLRDSGIGNDLKYEFGGESKSPEDFKSILEDRYPDAPQDLTELLISKGIIRRTGDNNFEIIK